MAESTCDSMGETGSLDPNGEESEEVFVADLGESLASALECPVCLEYMIPPIGLCESGHSICSVCRPKLTLCPSCRRPFLSTRNVALESLTSELEYPCRNNDCSEVFPLDLLVQHQLECPYRTYDCPLSLRATSESRCSWRGPRSAIQKHVLDAHRRYARIGCESTSVLRGVSSRVNYSLMIFAHDQVFVQRCSLKNGKFYSTVQLIGSKEEARRYRYEFLMCSDDGNQKVLIGSLTQSYSENLQELFSVGKCVRLDLETVEHFMCDKKLPFKLKIFQLHA